jgi:hypothetical protein
MIDFKKDISAEPIDENLKLVMGDSFTAYKTLLEKLPELDVELEWRFYKDGGWLAKVTRKKKTIFWGAPETGHFSIAFHFNEKTKHGVHKLEIANALKESFSQAPLVGGRFTSLVVDIYDADILPDVFTLINYKKRV